MEKEIHLPEISENVESGDVIQVLVSEGDRIEEDQPIIELETDKAAFEVPSPMAGRVTKIAVSEGDTLEVGGLILKVETDQKEEEKAPPAGPQEKGDEEEEAAEAREEKEPEPAEAREERKRPETAEAPEEPRREPEAGSVPAAPSVRRKARELGVDLTRVEGAGPGGRISAEDVQRYAKGVITSSRRAPAAGGEAAAVTLPDFSRWGETEREPMSSVRRITAESVSRAWRAVPHVTQFDQADITELEVFRKKYAAEVEKEGGKLTVTAILLKICAEALLRFPRFNASLDMAAREIIYKKYVHIGVAVDTDRGLLVPVIRDADKKGIFELSLELTDVAGKARGKKITPDDLQGGNFTISNLGGIGGTNFTPIVYAPQSAILGVSRARTEPVYREGELTPRDILPVALSYDHRIIDGAEGTRFTRWIVEALEHPLLLVFKGGL